MSSSSRGLKRPRAPVATDDDEEEDFAPMPSSASAAAVGAPDSAGGAADDAAAALGSGGAGSKRKYDGASELRPERLQAFEDAELRKGVVYVGRVPPFMKPIKIRQLLEAYGEVGRVYLAPEGKYLLRSGGRASVLGARACTTRLAVCILGASLAWWWARPGFSKKCICAHTPPLPCRSRRAQASHFCGRQQKAHVC